MSDDQFDDIAQDIPSPAVVVFTQMPDEWEPDYDTIGDVDLDGMIAMTVKGLFKMLLDHLDADPDDEEEDDESGDDPTSA